jgi:mevalonate pyrophosphate decarboxylase
MVRPLAALLFLVFFSCAAFGQSTDNTSATKAAGAQPAAKTARLISRTSTRAITGGFRTWVEAIFEAIFT